MANVLSITFEMVQNSYDKPIAPERAAWVNQKIDEAARELLSYIPNLLERISLGLVDQEFVNDKVIGSVLRVVRNPEGFETETEGDYAYRLNKTVASGDIWYLERDLIAMGWVAPLKKQTPRTVFIKSSRGFGFPR